MMTVRDRSRLNPDRHRRTGQLSLENSATEQSHARTNLAQEAESAAISRAILLLHLASKILPTPTAYMYAH